MKRARFTAAAAAAFCAPAIVRGQGLAPVRIGTIASEVYALTIYAKDQGFFAENGIDAQIQYIATASGGIASALIGGALDIGCVSMGATSNAHLRGIPIEIIAAGGIISHDAPTTQLVVGKDSPVKTPKDLNGKIVGASALRDVIQVAEAKFIDTHGGDSKTINFVELTPSAAPAALVAGRIDAYALSEPTLTFRADDLRKLGPVYDAICPRIMISIHVAMGDWLAKNTETARRAVRAMRQAARWVNANRAGADAIISKEAKIPPEVVAKMNHATFAENLDPTMIQPQIDALAEYKYIERRFQLSEVVWSGA